MPVAAWGGTETGWLGAGETRKESITAASTGGRREGATGESWRADAAGTRAGAESETVVTEATSVATGAGEPFDGEDGAPPMAGAKAGATARAADASGLESKDGLAAKNGSLGTAATASSARATGPLPLTGLSTDASGEKGSTAERGVSAIEPRVLEISATLVAAGSTVSCVGTAEREDAAPCPALIGAGPAATFRSGAGASASGVCTASIQVGVGAEAEAETGNETGSDPRTEAATASPCGTVETRGFPGDPGPSISGTAPTTVELSPGEATRDAGFSASESKETGKGKGCTGAPCALASGNASASVTEMNGSDEEETSLAGGDNGTAAPTPSGTGTSSEIAMSGGIRAGSVSVPRGTSPEPALAPRRGDD